MLSIDDICFRIFRFIDQTIDLNISKDIIFITYNLLNLLKRL